MVNCAREGQMQGKLWWRLQAILTCESFVTLGLWGERQAEPGAQQLYQVKRMFGQIGNVLLSTCSQTKCVNLW